MTGTAAGQGGAEGSSGAATLEARDLACRRAERPVFEKLHFALPPGGLLLLSGPNGSGKSSLLRLLAGLLRPTAGSLEYGGRAVFEELAAYHRRLHYLGHQEAAKPVLTGRENLAFWCRLRGAVPGDLEAALAAFHLGELADRPVRLYSAGQKRRLALARLLAAPAPLWLLDEPSVGLDLRSVAGLVAAVEAHRAGGGQVVLATHVDLGLSEPRRLELEDFAPAPLELTEWRW